MREISNRDADTIVRAVDALTKSDSTSTRYKNAIRKLKQIKTKLCRDTLKTH